MVTSTTEHHEAAEATLPAGTERSHIPNWVWPVVMILVLAVLYAWQLQPGIAPHGDISKFQFAGPLGGTVHQTGYPLYLMLSWSFAHLPFLDAATGTTAVSAAFALGAVAMAYLALRELRVRPPIATVFALVLGVAPVIFYYATVAEVYAGHLFFTAAVLALLLRWRRTGSDVDLGLAIAVLALSFTNHMGTSLLLPGVLWFVWRTDRGIFRRPGVWAFGAGSLVVAMAMYGYLIWRANDPATPFIEVAPETWRDLLSIWVGTGGATFVLGPGEADAIWGRIPDLVRLVVASSLLALPFAFFGFRSLYRDAAGAMLALWLAATAAFTLLYAAPDPQSFIPPGVFVLIVTAGVGAEWIAARYVSSSAVAAVALGLIAVTAVAAGIRFVGVQSHDEYAERTRGWVAEIPPGSVLTANYTDAMAVFHLNLIEGTRTDVVTVSDYPLADPAGSVIGRYLAGETVVVPHTREVLEPGRPVYAPGEDFACDLAGAGFGIHTHTASLFLVLPIGAASDAPALPAACWDST